MRPFEKVLIFVSGGYLLAMGLISLAGIFPPPSSAQDATDRTRAALPALVEQRNNAMDAAALCQGDVAILKQQLADAKAEIEKLKVAPPK